MIYWLLILVLFQKTNKTKKAYIGNFRSSEIHMKILSEFHPKWAYEKFMWNFSCHFHVKI